MWCCNQMILMVIALLLAESVLTSSNEDPILEDGDADAILTESPDVENKNIPGIDAPMPSREQLLEMLDSLAGLSTEEKENLRADLLNNIQQKHTINQTTLNNNNFPTQALLLFSFLGILSLMFVFIINKLYKSDTLRERKLQEKRQQKKSKKNKKIE